MQGSVNIVGAKERGVRASCISIPTQHMHESDSPTLILQTACSSLNTTWLPFYFAQERAINFARITKAQAFWVQAADSPPNWFCNGYTTDELQKMKKMVELPCQEDRRYPIFTSLLLQHAVCGKALGRSGLQKVWRAQRISLQTESMGAGRKRRSSGAIK